MATDEIRLSTYGETIEIQQGLNGRVVLQVQTDDGHAAPVLTPPECDALIAAIGRALGRPAPASPRYAPSEELLFSEPLCAALVAACATQEQALAEITKAMQDYRAKAVKLALEQTRPMIVVLDGGRAAPTSTPLEERIAASLRGAQQAKPFATDQGRAQGIVEVWERALAMVREQGALSDRDLSQLRALVGQSQDDTFDQCIREIEALIARLKTEREMGAQWERDEIENMIGADTSPGILAVADRLIAMVRARSGEAAREQGATVPRAGVLPILNDLRSIATALDFENTPGACSAWRRLEEAIGTLAKLTAAPATQTENG